MTGANLSIVPSETCTWEAVYVFGKKEPVLWVRSSDGMRMAYNEVVQPCGFLVTEQI
jgi:hypothetical protein